MKAFIRKDEFNYIRRCLFDLNNSFGNCVDPLVLEGNKLYIQNKIYEKFTNLTSEQKELLNISNIIDSSDISFFIKNLEKYVYGMPKVTASELVKLFKKEKKLKIPDLNNNNKKIYLGWVDPAVNKLHIVYNYNNKLLKMSCRITNGKTSNSNICALCNYVGKQEEVTFVSPVCKTSNGGPDAYKSLGFYICLDSEKCNERMISTEKIEEIIKEVNNIKD